VAEIYLDNSATTRPFEEVIELQSRIQRENYGNPSSIHARGVAAEKLLDEARRSIAQLLQCREEEICFTSGGTEANNLALKGAAYRWRRRGNHIITTQIEHPSVLNCCRRLEEEGFTVTYLPVDEQGYVDLEQLERALRKETILVSIIHVNNEIGTIQPVEKIGRSSKAAIPGRSTTWTGCSLLPRFPRRCSAGKPTSTAAARTRFTAPREPVRCGCEKEYPCSRCSKEETRSRASARGRKIPPPSPLLAWQPGSAPRKWRKMRRASIISRRSSAESWKKPAWSSTLTAPRRQRRRPMCSTYPSPA